MTDMWIDLLPVLFAMLISPARTLAVILLLHTPRTTATALGYVAGMVSAMMVQGAALGAGIVVGGVILLAGAFTIATAPASGGGSLASALERLETIEPAGAYKVGFGWLLASPKQWVFVLTAVAVIFTAQLRAIGGVANFLVFTLLVQSAYLVIIAAYALAEDRIAPLLDAVFGWIKDHLRGTAIGVFAFFGIVFLLEGLATLG